jgi:hypothetical protein
LRQLAPLIQSAGLQISRELGYRAASLPQTMTKRGVAEGEMIA